MTAEVTRVKTFDPNPDRLTEGELLPCLGGPLDGQARGVTLLFDVMPNAILAYRDGNYVRQGREYRWMENAK